MLARASLGTQSVRYFCEAHGETFATHCCWISFGFNMRSQTEHSNHTIESQIVLGSFENEKNIPHTSPRGDPDLSVRPATQHPVFTLLDVHFRGSKGPLGRQERLNILCEETVAASGTYSQMFALRHKQTESIIGPYNIRHACVPRLSLR